VIRGLKVDRVAGISAQAVNTLGNVALSLLVARESSAVEYGGWAIAYGIYILCLGIFKATVSTSLLIDENAGAGGYRRAGSSNVSVALLVGFVGGLVMYLVSLLTSESVGLPLVLFALLLPGLLLHDALRYVFIKMSKASWTLAIDGLWFVIQICAFVWLISINAATMTSLTLAWGVSATVVGLAVCCAARLRFSFREPITFFSRSKGVTTKLLVDSIINTGTVALVPIAVGAVVSIEAAGFYRAGLTLLGPVGLLIAGLSPFLTVDAVGKLTSFRIAVRMATKWILGITVISIPYCLAVTLIPDSVGEKAMGEVWLGISGYLLAFAVHGSLRGPNVVVPILLRSAHKLDSLIRLRVRMTVPHLVLPVAFGAVWGFEGVVWGSVAGVVSANCQCLLALRLFRG